jgi:hypothetical protein
MPDVRNARVPDTRQASAGPLQSIQDETTRKELRKLWDVVGMRSGQTGNASDKWVTVSELNAAKRELLGKIPKVEEQKGFRQEIGGGHSSGGATASSDNLLPRNNTWTGSNYYTRKSLPDSPTIRVQSYNSGTIVAPGGGPTIMLNSNYHALIDVRKTSSANGDAKSGGGNAAIYVQHRVDGTTAGINNVNCGIRVQMESWQRCTPGLINDVVSGYFGLVNHGLDSGGFGVHVDAYHWGTGQTVTYGSSVELYRAFLDGKVIGFHCRQAGFGNYTAESDYGFLASPQAPGSGIGIKTVFSAGSDYAGALRCDVGLDLAYATCTTAAIRVPSNTRIQLNGAANNVGFFFDPVGKIQFFSDIGTTVSIGNDGSLRVKPTGHVEFVDGSYSSVTMGYTYAALAMKFAGTPMYEFHQNGTLGLLNPDTTAGAGRQFGYFVINLGDFLRKVPFYAMA